MIQRLAAIALPVLFALAGAAAGDDPPGLPRGEITGPVSTVEDTGETYALYLPADYVPDKKWPIVFVLDPRSRGRMAAELFRPAAERFGYILISSNSSRSDSLPGENPNPRALLALLNDAMTRFAADADRVYFAGFSGTARFAWLAASRIKGQVAGVIGCGGALPGSLDAYGDVDFAFYGVAGDTDFNHREMRWLDDELDATAIVHRFDYFPGGHQWAPPEVLTDALAWMEVLAMKAGTRPADGALIEELYAAGAGTAAALEASGALHDAHRRWRQLGRDFDRLRDVAAARQAAARLGEMPQLTRDAAAVRAATSRELAYRQLLDAGLARIETSRPIPPLRLVASQLKIPRLKKQAQGHSIDARAAQRQLESAFVHTVFYLPRRLRLAGQTERAVLSLRVAAEIKPDHWRPWYALAAAHAGAGRKARAIEALAHAIEVGYSNLAYIEGDGDLDPIRGEAGYRRIVEGLRP